MTKYITLFLLMSTGVCFAQAVERMDTIYACSDKTTTIIFPSEIILYDIGSDNFGGMKSTNLLLLKSVAENVPPTNILVQYGGTIYHGTLAYKANPPLTFIDFRNKEIPTMINENRVSNQDSSKSLDDDVAGKRLAMVISDPKVYYKTINTNNEKIILTLVNMMSDNHNLYIKLLFINNSKFGYQMDFTEFIYKDPLQDKDLKGGFDRKNVNPIVPSKIDFIEGKSERTLGFAIPRFNLSKKGELNIVIREKNGSRLLELIIPYSEILSASSILKN